MPKLYIVVEVPEAAADPKTTDPHNVAEDIVYAYNEAQQANGELQIDFIAAEWSLAALGQG